MVLLNLNVDGKELNVVLNDYQADALKGKSVMQTSLQLI